MEKKCFVLALCITFAGTVVFWVAGYIPVACLFSFTFGVLIPFGIFNWRWLDR